MFFFDPGHLFTTTEALALSWQINSLMMRLTDLKDEDPCPSFSIKTGHLHTRLDLKDPPPSVSLCIRVLTTLDYELEQWGSKEMKIAIGEGDPTDQQGRYNPHSVKGLLELRLKEIPDIDVA